MESVDLQMEDIFGDQEGDDDDLFTSHAAIPDLPPNENPEELTAGAEGEENDAVLARIRDLSKGAAKQKVKRVQPKLDATRLTGDRGIGVLPKVFKDIQFKGKGHEAEDLRKMMKYLEHWAHRLFPKMPFDEVLERVEKLGTKREVQTYIKRMRLDIPVENENNAVEEENEDIFNTSATETVQETKTANTSRIDEDEEEVLDELMREEDERIKHSQPVSTPSSTSTFPSTPNTSTAQATPTAEGLTAEQLERIEANRRLARERLAKLGQKTPGTPSVPRPSQVNTPLVYPSTPSVDTSTANTPTIQALSASPVVAEGKGDNSESAKPEQISTVSEELDEEKLLETLEDENVPVQEEQLDEDHLLEAINEPSPDSSTAPSDPQGLSEVVSPGNQTEPTLRGDTDVGDHSNEELNTPSLEEESEPPSLSILE